MTSDNIKKSIGSIVKALRSQQGIYQRELAKQVNVSRTTISALETGAATDILLLNRVSQALGVNMSEIIEMAEYI